MRLTERSSTKERGGETAAAREGTRPGLKTQLRAASFAEGEAMLAPVQRLGSAGDLPPAEGHAQTGDPVDARTTTVAMERIAAYSAAIDKAAEHWGVSASEIKAIIAVESVGIAEAGSGRTFRGLMQIDQTAWDETCKRNGLTYDFAKQWSDPEINIFVGTGVYFGKRTQVERLLELGYGGAGLKPGAKDNDNPFDAQHPDHQAICQLAYNAGQGTIVEAMKLAGSTRLDELTQPEHLERAIENKIPGYGPSNFPWRRYMSAEFQALDAKAQGAFLATEAGAEAKHAAEAAANAACKAKTARKYEEIVNYSKKTAHYFEKFEALAAEERAKAEKAAADKEGAASDGGEDRDGGKTTSTSAVAVALADGPLKLYDGCAHTTPHRNAAVVELQSRLRELGFRIKADGEFGAYCESTLKHAQTRFGLPATGQVDAVTWRVLGKSSDELEALQLQARSDDEVVLIAIEHGSIKLYDGFAHTTPERRGAVAAIQRKLVNGGFRCKVDGEFGVHMEQLVRTHQTSVGLPATGEVDGATWEALKTPATAKPGE